jgi:FkbM family methyltransferase
MSEPTISYAQRYEDMHLARCFGERTSGFYIDIGAGHPVYDNVSFAFYLRGWSGITVEPNPWLAQLSAAVRPRDRRIQSLVGAAAGEATYYLVEDFHGLSTTITSHAQAAQAELGKAVQTMIVPVTTLRTMCEQHAPATIDFLKVDVEGAEPDVLAGGDWQRFRPKVVVVEALAPLTLAPSWQSWEPTLTSNGYRFAFFDTLNRYYVGQEDDELAARLAAEPPSFDNVKKLGSFRPALDDATHPDHRLATLLAGADMVRLPLLDAEAILSLLAGRLQATDLGKTATATDIALAHERLFGGRPSDAWVAGLALSRDATTRELYLRIIASERFRAACGRISASYAW